MPGRKTEIEEFEKAVKAINALYLQNIELCEDAEDRAREQFSGQLETKDKLIADLQTRLEKAEDMKSYPTKAKAATEKIFHVVTDLCGTAVDKSRIGFRRKLQLRGLFYDFPLLFQMFLQADD